MNITEFTVTENHLKLIRNINTNWHWGELQVNRKRPFGNSDIHGDIAEILNWEIPDWENTNEIEIEAFSDKCDTMLKETSIAFQIVITTGEFKIGIYHIPEYEWILKD